MRSSCPPILRLSLPAPRRWLLAAGAGWITAALASCGKAPPNEHPAPPTAVPVRVDSATGMSRGGQPYFVKGAGGKGCPEQLAARGANSIRTWNTKGLDAILDRAQDLGLTVSAGIWLEHECAWFSYRNPAHCDKQAERVRREVMAFRDHPALLAWGLGNEVEGDGTNTAFWRQLDRLARLVREIDPAHPTFTAVAGMSAAKAEGMNGHAPHLDYVGINTYGGVFGLRKHLEKIGWKRPWMLTEWGPRGFWESPASASGAPVEQTSSEKAEMIRRAYQDVISPDGGCLGSYVFVWGWKFEATATWFGVFTHQGESTAVADALQELWGGTRPANRAPDIGSLRGVPKGALPPGRPFEADVRATDPDGDPLTFEWSVLPEHRDHRSHTRTSMPEAMSGAIAGSQGGRVSVTAPGKPGIYRLHVWVRDGQGHAATANQPFEVR